MRLADKKNAAAAILLFLPTPAMGHLVPMVELAKRILQMPSPSRRFSVTILSVPPPEPDPQLSSYLSAVSSATPEISFLHLPSVDRSVLPGNPGMEALLCAFIESMKPLVKSTIQALQLEASPPGVPVAAIVLDLFWADMIDFASEIGIPPYIFFTCSASWVDFALYFSFLDATLRPEKDMDELHEEGYTIDLPGFSTPLPPICLPNPFFYRKSPSCSSMVHLVLRSREAEGLLLNTYAELEPGAVNALEQGLCIPDRPTPPIYTVGPVLSLDLNLNLKSSPEAEQHECVTWLNDQPPASVVFLCFGSMGAFRPTQAKEIATALERSGLRFLWVLRSPPPPPEKEEENLLPPLLNPVDARLEEVLPDGFLERTRGRGLVWPKFAPQKQILGHEAVGGFVTHCGWNSCLESLWFGVPMLGWPLYAEQHFNAACMEGEMGVAVALGADRNGGNWAAAEEVERGLRCLMEEGACEKGRDARAQALRMKEGGRRALQEDGSSYLSLSRWVAEVGAAIDGRS